MKKEPVPNTQLRQARVARRLSLAKAAELAGVSLEAFSRWEYGTQVPRLSSLELLCEGFKCTPEEVGFAYLVQLQDARAAEERPVIQLTEEQTALVASLLQGDDIIMFDASKRRTLEQIFTAAGIVLATPLEIVDPEPWERIFTGKAQDINPKTLDHFETLTKVGWELSNSSELNVAELMVPTFLPRLLQLAPLHPTASKIAAQGLRLQSVLAAHKLRLDEKVVHCQQAVDYALASQDPNTLVSSYIELAVAYKYIKRTDLSLKTYQETLSSVEQASPLLQSRAYAALSSGLAKTGRMREARFYLDLAHEVFPSHPDQDPFAVLADYGIWLLIFYTGSTYLDLGQYEQAWQAFDQISNVSATVPERNRLEIVNQQGKAALLLNDLKRYTMCLEDGLGGSIALGSRKRYDEAVTIFQQDMPKTWRHEQRIRDIAEKYHLVLPD